MRNPGLMPLALGALALWGSGCMKNTYVTTKPSGGGTYTQKASFFINGLIGEKTVDLNQVCPQGVSWFQNRKTIGDSVVGCLTCALYTPLTIEVRCAGGGAFLAVPDPGEGVTWFYPQDPNDISGGEQ